VPGGLTHLLVAVDKFTKWIEAKPIKKLDGSSTIKFFNDIITRYGVPAASSLTTGRTLQRESSLSTMARRASGWT
jgi:hypothetical protein